MEIGEEVLVEFGVADVSSIEEGDEIEETQPGNDLNVETPEELPVLCYVSVDNQEKGAEEYNARFPLVAEAFVRIRR